MKKSEIKIGEPVFFIDRVGEYPIVPVSWGETGTIMGWTSDGENDLLRVRLDMVHIDLTEWDNEIHVHEHDLVSLCEWGKIPFDYVAKCCAEESCISMLAQWAAVESFRLVDKMSDDHVLNHVCGTIQSILGQTDGGYAGIFFSGPDECQAATRADSFAARERVWMDYIEYEWTSRVYELEEQVAENLAAG